MSLLVVDQLGFLLLLVGFLYLQLGKEMADLSASTQKYFSMDEREKNNAETSRAQEKLDPIYKNNSVTAD